MTPGLRVLVTGAAGQLGASLKRVVKEYPDLGVELLCPEEAAFDITDTEAVESQLSALKPDALINAAAYTAVDKAESDAERAHLVNAVGAGILARACAKAQVMLIQVSTDYVFDGQAHSPYGVDAPAAPLGVYGMTKWQGEQAVQAAYPDALIVRTSWVFSEYGQNFLKTMLRLATERDQLSIVADQQGGPTYAPQLAFFLLQLLGLKQRQHVSGGVYHFCGEPYTSWFGFASAIFEQAETMGVLAGKPSLSPITSAEFPTPAQRPPYTCLDMAHTRTLGLELHNDWREGLKDALSRSVHI